MRNAIIAGDIRDVARRLGLELNEDYIELANKRLAAVQRPLFVE
jgi:hypothetical protein